MSTDISVESFSELIGSVYAAALDPGQWQEFSRLLAAATGSLVGFVGIVSAPYDADSLLFTHGMPPRYLELYQQTLTINPLLPSIALCQSGDVVVNSWVVPEEELIRSQFYAQFVQPLGLRDSMFIVCLRSGPRVGTFGVNRAAGAPLYVESDTTLLRLLMPHVARAMTISDAFDLQTIKSDALEASLDGLAAGVFLLDAAGRVVHLNRAAEHMTNAGRVLTVRENRLWPLDKDSRDRLLAALARDTDITGPLAPEDAAVALRAVDDSSSGMMATLLPLEPSGRAFTLHTSAARWAVFVQDPHVAMPLPGEAFARLYKLTPAELRIALALLPGLTPDEAAAMLGITVPTVRTHLQRIYAKTSTNRQIDLVRLMMSTMPPMTGAA
jgi:DNA-binding CsgD family transcriptional regulator/PAS domain-containing protein